MLVLTRREAETIHIGDDIVIHVVSIGSQRNVRLGIEAPSDVSIMRGELVSGPEATGAVASERPP